MRRTGPGDPAGVRRRVFLIITLATPLLLFLACEGLLRVFGYGPDLSLFTTETLAGRTYTVMNPAVKNRYFARVPFNPSTSPDYFLSPKPAGTFRIFCLGGSTTVGYPYWYNGSFSSFLRDRLRALFPDRPLDVINLGMTATNSYTVNDMAGDVLRHGEPDLLIVYDGHNEFYGALGVASNESVGGSPWITRLYLSSLRLRTVVLLRSIIAGGLAFLQTDAPQERGVTMMERLAAGQEVPYDSPLYRTGLHVYRANVTALLEAAREQGVPVLLGSQVSNLRDLPPFVPVPRADMTPADSLARLQFIQEAWAGAAGSDTAAAIRSCRGALSLDSMNADTWYRTGRIYDTLGLFREAHLAYVRARDLDALRFRMSSDFNDALRTLCGPPGGFFVDMEGAFREESKDSLIGNDLIMEHLHPNARGFFLMGRAYARAMAAASIMVPREEWIQRDTLSEERLWEERPITELDERMAGRRTEILLAGWPFAEGIPTVDPVPAADTIGQIAEKVTRGEWNWMRAHMAAAEHYLRRGDRRRAAASYRTIINQLPLLDATPYLMLARLNLDERRFAEAGDHLRASLAIGPTILACRALADLSFNAGKYAEAVEYYRRTFTFPQPKEEQVQNGYLLALAAARGGDTLTARQEVLKVLALQPDFQPAAALLAGLGPVAR